MLLPVYLSHRRPFCQPGGEIPLDPTGDTYIRSYAVVGQGWVPAPADPALHCDCRTVPVHCAGVPVVAGYRTSDCHTALCSGARHVWDADGTDLPQAGRGQ